MELCEPSSKPLNALCEALLDGFHVAAQPLTMLHAALSTECTALLPETELRELAATCSREADRMVRIFSSLKLLVHSYHYPPAIGSVDLGEILRSRIERNVVNGEGQTLPVTTQANAELPLVRADREATTHVIQSLVGAVGASGGSDEAIEIRCESRKDAVQLVISGAACLDRMPGELKLALQSASLRMELQEGTATWRTSPFAVELIFPLAMSAE